MAEHLFVYGTLRRGSDHQAARILAEQAQFVAAACVPGRLYDFGRYPGATRSHRTKEWVIGEVFSLDEPAIVLGVLDDYEGLEYERATVSASLDDGRIIECWIYWYRGDSAGPLIESGDWFRR